MTSDEVNSVTENKSVIFKQKKRRGNIELSGMEILRGQSTRLNISGILTYPLLLLLLLLFYCFVVVVLAEKEDFGRDMTNA